MPENYELNPASAESMSGETNRSSAPKSAHTKELSKSESEDRQRELAVVATMEKQFSQQPAVDAKSKNTPIESKNQAMDFKARVRAACDPSTHPADLLALAEIPTLHDFVARNPSTPPALLEKYYRTADQELMGLNPDRQDALSSSYNVRKMFAALAKNPACPQEILKALLYVNGERSVLENPACPKEILDRSIRSIDSTVRYLAIQHPNMSPDTLDRMCSSKDDEMRSYVAEHPKTPESGLRRMMSNESDRYVLYAIVRNPSCPTDLKTLAINRLDTK